MSEDYKHIWYKDCPHFTIGTVDQWGENGYLYFDNEVYFYFEDRKGQYGEVSNPKSVAIFIQYAKANKIEIPEAFMKVILKD